jgi:hypothetical protein
MKPAEVKALNPRLSPRLDVFLGGSDEVNAGRAEQCPSVAVSAPSPGLEATAPTQGATDTVGSAGTDTATGFDTAQDVVRPIRILRPAKVARLAADLQEDVTPTRVGFSAFVQIDRDLDPQAHARAVAAVRKHATRVHWKLDTASVETTAAGVSRLLDVPGVSYVEPGQTLRAGRRRPHGAPRPECAQGRHREPSAPLRPRRARRHHRRGRFRLRPPRLPGS